MTHAQPSILRSIARAHNFRPHDYRDDLPGQREFLEATEKEVVWFGHNGCGKTEALCRRLIRVFEGTDPICEGVTRPLTLLLIVTNYDAVSARDLADQLHEMMPPGLVAQVEADEKGKPISRASSWYGRGKGFRGRPPRLVVQKGPMKGSALNVSTLGAGSSASAGGTIDVIIINEPINQDLHDELASRDRADALGHIWYAFTPIPDAPDQTWIPDTVQRTKDAGGSIRFIQTQLSRESLTFPSGRPLESWEEKTAPRIAKWDDAVRPMRMGQSLEPIFEEGYFARVWRDELIVDRVPAGLHLWLVGSLDHSLQEGRMCVGVTGFHVTGHADSRQLCAYDLIDVRATSSRIDEAAEMFLDALDAARIPIEEIDEWIGDRSTQDRHYMVKRDNLEWKQAVLRALRNPKRLPPKTAASSIHAPRALWEIETPRKRAGSSWHTMNRLRQAMADQPPRLRFLRRCTNITRDIPRWDGRKQAKEKDSIDRLGYAWDKALKRFDLWRSVHQ